MFKRGEDMCQLNLYIVPKTVKKESVLSIMKDCFGYQEPECVTDENYLPGVQDLNDIYISAGMGCNCGTVQTLYQSNSDGKSWLDVKKEIALEKVERLNKIKTLLEREDYLEYKNRVLGKSHELENRIKESKGRDYENVMKEWQLFFSENSLLYDAMMKYEKIKTENGKEIVYHNIDDEIKNIEKFEFENIENEYEDLVRFIDAILEQVDEVKLLSFWQDGNSPYVKNEKFVMRNDLKIDDIIFLKENELLTIFAG